MNNMKTRGFTIVELMISLAIGAVLFSIGMPALRDAVMDNRMTNSTNEMILALTLARSEAITRKRNTFVTALNFSNGANEWGFGGWVVWMDNNNNGNRDVPAEDIRQFGPYPDTTFMDGPNGETQLQFLPSGVRLAGANNPYLITVCDSRAGEVGRQITLTIAGRPTLNRRFLGC